MFSKAIDEMKGWSFANPATFGGALVYGVLFIAIAWLIGRALRLMVQRIVAHNKNDHFDLMAIRFLARLARYGVYFFAFISYAHLVHGLSGLGLASLASVSVISVVLGLAAQNTLGNVIAGLSLLLYRPFKLGDRLQVTAPTGLETGTVESVTLGYTLLRTDENRRIVLPNSLMASQTNINLSTIDRTVLWSIAIGIGYGANIDKARGILLDLGANHPATKSVNGCPIIQLNPSGIVFSLDLWCADALTAITLRSDLLEQSVKRFKFEGIALPLLQTRVMGPETSAVHGMH